MLESAQFAKILFDRLFDTQSDSKLLLGLSRCEFFDMHFPGRWVGRDEPIPWPPLDLFLCAYVKTSVTSLDELKLRIVAAVETVTPQMLENTWR
jgi:hypothetical protein